MRRLLPLLPLLFTLALLPAPALAEDTATQAAQTPDPRSERLFRLIQRAPALSAEIIALQQRGLNLQLTVTDQQDQPQALGRPTQAALVADTIVLNGALIERLDAYGRRMHQANGDAALVYVLAHQVGHARLQPQYQQLQQEVIAQVRSRGADALRQDLEAQAAINQRMIEMEAQATLIGWNLALDFWLHSKGIANDDDADSELEARQAMELPQLMLQLPHFQPIELAMKLPQEQRIRIGANRIVIDAHNIAAVVAGLKAMPQVLDID